MLRLFTDRFGGASMPPYAELNLAEHVGDDPAAVAENRRIVAGRAALEPHQVVWMQQVHGCTVTTVSEPSAEPIPNTDALVTATPGLALAVLVADCVPVLLADETAGIVAAVHAGRRGVASGVVVEAVDAMRDLGARTERISAWLGPAICGTCYEVGPEIADQVTSVVPAAASTSRGGGPALDLRRALSWVLESLGVAEVRTIGPCTAESAAHFSYRRDGTTGRFAGLIAPPG